MQKVSLASVRAEFKSRLQSGMNVVVRLQAYRIREPNRVRTLSPAERERLAEMAWIQMFLAWEEFLEESFVRYLLGARSPRGPRPHPLVVVRSLEQARKLILGEGRSYLDWTDPGRLIERSALFFKDGEPYSTAIRSASTHLSRMKTVRNRIAHRSQAAVKKYDSLLLELYGPRRRFSPGHILLSPPPQSALPARGGQGAASLFALYHSILAATADQIVRP